MKKIKEIKGNILLSVGLILVSIAIFLKDIVNAPNICEFITGFGIGIELVGIFKQCKENKIN